MSDWNLYFERKLALPLGLEASRLADAIARYTLGWNGRSNHIGQKLLRDLSGLDGRSFERARKQLVDAALLRFERGSGGRGNRDRYELLLDVETPAVERANEETPAGERANRVETPAQTSAETPAQTPARERARREKGVKRRSKDLAADASSSSNGDGSLDVEALRRGNLILDDCVKCRRNRVIDDKTCLCHECWTSAVEATQGAVG